MLHSSASTAQRLISVASLCKHQATNRIKCYQPNQRLKQKSDIISVPSTASPPPPPPIPSPLPLPPVHTSGSRCHCRDTFTMGSPPKITTPANTTHEPTCVVAQAVRCLQQCPHSPRPLPILPLRLAPANTISLVSPCDPPPPNPPHTSTHPKNLILGDRLLRTIPGYAFHTLKNTAPPVPFAARGRRHREQMVSWFLSLRRSVRRQAPSSICAQQLFFVTPPRSEDVPPPAVVRTVGEPPLM